MVEEKVIQYKDGMTINCINEKNAKVFLSYEFLNNAIKKNKMTFEDIANEFTQRLKTDFNFAKENDCVIEFNQSINSLIKRNKMEFTVINRASS